MTELAMSDEGPEPVLGDTFPETVGGFIEEKLCHVEMLP
jgi:hypothetical protein